ncbi:cellulase family glycosylhydrolase [Flavivirga rizhaonensis]|uniref:Glycoside hydrolase family 5 domain-containing protein n=1 Tax=Flavivirga rizhaonensis TaxID=2559571 RepID=A0A4S1DY03_9FLAO|nr:cellulase family glycosylhydrolase [Flavivirga rizhaonensis]TGV02428.1 hypothetical protein EM932_10775 [Flavivirga rizhaonensis]
MPKALVSFILLIILFSCKEAGTIDKRYKLKFKKSNIIDLPFIGHGVQWSAYPHADSYEAEWGFLMTDEKWNELYKRLDFVNPHIIRVMDVSTWRYYKGLDVNNQPILDFNTQEVKSLYKVLDYCQKNDITVLFGEWGAPGLWKTDKNPNNINRADDVRWIEMITKYLEHLIVEKGYTCIKYYNLVNEPNGYWASTNGDWEQWKAGYQLLNNTLKSKGLDKYVTLAGPDAVTQWNHPTHPKKAEDWVYSTINDLDSITALYDFHIYADQELIRTGNFQTYLTPFTTEVKKTKKPLILGELGMKYSGDLKEENLKKGKADPFAGPDDSSMFVYDYFYGVDMADAAIQSMLAGVGGAVAWDLDDAMHTVGDLGEKSQLKKWGMWNILAEEFGDLEVDKTPRPWSYSWTLLCNLFPPNAKLYKPEFSIKNDSIRAIASVTNKNVTLAVVNQSKTYKTFNIETEGLIKKRNLYVYEYIDGKRALNADGFPVPSKSFEYNENEVANITVQPKSVVFLSSILLN